jgi:tRNA(Ile)-lysidine synthase
VSELPLQVERFIQRHRLFGRGERILVAVSGGVDSMVLLHALKSLAQDRSWKLHVAHFNHRLRGRSSDADERLVSRAARELGLAVTVGRASVREFAREHKLSLEMAARKLRHEFLARTARKTRSKVIALAHHADDQVELFFLRLLRGSGGDGLSGMKPMGTSPSDSKIRLARPLLAQAKADLRAFAAEMKITFREDASNQCLDIRRNRIRHELLPLLRRHYQPALDKTALRVMDILGAEAELAAAAAREALRKNSAFARLPVAVQRRLIQLQLRQLDLEAGFDLVEALRTSDRPVAVAPGISAARDAAGRIHLKHAAVVEQKEASCELNLRGPSGRARFDGLEVLWRRVKRRNSILPEWESRREFFDASAVGETVRLRHWRPGDRFQPIGMNAPCKLQDIFVNQHIAREARHGLVVAESASGTLFWVEGLRISEQFKLASSTSKMLEWRWRRL